MNLMDNIAALDQAVNLANEKSFEEYEIALERRTSLLMDITGKKDNRLFLKLTPVQGCGHGGAKWIDIRVVLTSELCDLETSFVIHSNGSSERAFPVTVTQWFSEPPIEIGSGKG